MIRNKSLAVMLMALVALGAGASAAGERREDPFHPAAPQETRQLAFLLGDWALDTPFGEATMHVETILDGFAIQVTQRYPSKDKKPDYVTTTIYVFDTVDKQWTGASVNTLGNRKFENGKFENGEFTFTVDGNMFNRQKVIRRNTYHQITANSFSLKQDSSGDQGETWKQGTYAFTAKRTQQ
jgi:hypothetical protein